MYTIISGVVTRDSDGKNILPCDNWDDADFKAYRNYVHDGGQVSIVDDSKKMVSEVSMKSALKVLERHGYLMIIESIIAKAGKEAEIDFKYSQVCHRNNPLVMTAIDMGVFTAEKVDEMFLEAVDIDNTTMQEYKK